MSRVLGTIDEFQNEGRVLGAVDTPLPPAPPSQSIWQQLAQGATNAVTGIANSIEQPVISLAATPVQALAKATGQPDPFQGDNPLGFGGSTVHPSPLSLEAKTGDALKVGATAAGFATAPASLAGAVGTGAAIGGAQLAGDAMQKEASAREVVKQGGIGAALGGAAGGLVYGIGSLIQKAGDKIMKSIIRPTTPDIKDGFKMDTVKKFNLGGSLQTTYDKTQSKLNELTAQLNTKLQGATEKVNLQQVFQDTTDELLNAGKLKSFGANGKIASSLEQLKGEISAVGNDLAIPDAQLVKQAAGHFGAWQYGKQDPEAKASEIVYNTFYNKLKTAIEQASPEGVRDINKQLSELIPVMNAVIRRMPVAERSNLISLNSMIGLVGTAANPGAALPTALALLSKSGTAGNIMSNVGPQIANQSNKAALATGLSAQPILGTKQNQQQEAAPVTSTDNTTLGTSVNPDGTITFKGPFSGEPITFDPNAVGGTIKGATKITAMAKEFLTKEPPAGLIKDLKAVVDHFDWGQLPSKEKDAASFLKDVRDQLAKRGIDAYNMSELQLARFAAAVQDLADVPARLRDAFGRFSK